MKTFAETDKYELRYDGIMGVGDILRKADGISTPLFTGSEGWDDLASYHLALTLHGPDHCDGQCDEHFTIGATVYDKHGTMGYIGPSGKWEPQEDWRG